MLELETFEASPELVWINWVRSAKIGSGRLFTPTSRRGRLDLRVRKMTAVMSAAPFQKRSPMFNYKGVYDSSSDGKAQRL
jgi:hypothetical protein